MLAQAGVPVENIKKILDGHYEVWDDGAVYWEDYFPGKGKLAMELLGPVYEYPFGLASVPSDVELSHMVNKAFPVERGPLCKWHNISFVKPQQFMRDHFRFRWLDEYTTPSQKKVFDGGFPWQPVESSLRDSGRFEFQVYNDILSRELRVRLWKSLENTLGNIWAAINGQANRNVADPWIIRDLWMFGNCLPAGFNSGYTDTFLFILTRRDA